MPPEDVFEPYGPSHWGALVVCVLGAVIVVSVGRRLRGSGAEVVFSRVFAVVLAVYALAMLVYRWWPGQFDMHIALPVHLSDLAWMVAVIALWTRAQWASGLTYYWGLTLNPQAILTPALNSPDFPHIDFVDLWTQHLLVLWAALYLTWGRGTRVSWRSYRMALVVTVAWAAAVFWLNGRLGTNYGFLNAKPDNPSVLDLFGSWPWYLAVEFLIIAAVWALMTWPWTIRRPADDSAGVPDKRAAPRTGPGRDRRSR